MWSVNYRLVARIRKNNTNDIRQKQHILGFEVNKTFWITFHTAKHCFSTTLPIISYRDYLIKMGPMDEEQAVLEQLTLSDSKKSSSTTLKSHSQVWENFWKLKALKKYWKMLFDLNTLLEFSVMLKNGLIRKIRLISKF